LILLFLEIKIDKEKLTATQKLFIKIFHRCSGVLYVDNETGQFTFIGPSKFSKVLEAFTKKRICGSCDGKGWLWLDSGKQAITCGACQFEGY